jgi:prophage DNA circulation protein
VQRLLSLLLSVAVTSMALFASDSVCTNVPCRSSEQRDLAAIRVLASSDLVVLGNGPCDVGSADLREDGRVQEFKEPTTPSTDRSSEPTVGQNQFDEPPGQLHAAPITLTLQDALARAQKNDAQFLSIVTAAKLAHEDRVQARASLLPGLSSRTEYLGTQGNGVLPTGRYVTNDGVHVYRQWGVLHQDFSPVILTGTAYRRSGAAEAMARARAEVARRGLVVTATKAYYALISANASTLLPSKVWSKRSISSALARISNAAAKWRIVMSSSSSCNTTRRTGRSGRRTW